jgi:transposase-like protein
VGDVLDDISVELSCPRCHRRTPKMIGWIKTNAEFVCEECGELVALVKDDLMQDVREVEEALREMGTFDVG